MTTKVNQAQVDEAIAKGWELPDFTIKEIRDAIPSHCFERDTFRSFSYVLQDVVLVMFIGYLATYIDTFPMAARILLWPTYWFVQGAVGTGLWVLGHECGHQAFSPSKLINNTVGMVLHSSLLVPYHSWRISHSRHHKSTGHMKKDQVFLPTVRSKLGLPPREADPEGDGPHSAFDESPIVVLFNMSLMFLFGWPLYILTNIAGQDYPGWASHFNPNCAIFEKHQYWDVMQSSAGVTSMLLVLGYTASKVGLMTVLKYYGCAYLSVNAWVVLITYLQHTDAALPHYRDNVWNFQRGAALTVDRSYGSLVDHLQHHIADSHVAHHFFSTMPHYHAKEATKHIKKVLGKHYHYSTTPIPIALWNSWKLCRFVEDEGDVVFYKN